MVETKLPPCILDEQRMSSSDPAQAKIYCSAPLIYRPPCFLCI